MSLCSLRLARIVGLVGLLALIAPDPSHAAKKSYSYETDPIRLGMKAIDEERLDEAKTRFEEALANEYQAYRAYYGLAEILRRQGNFVDAEAKYREALAAVEKEKGTKEFPECDAGLGLNLLRLGRTEEAGQEFEKALAAKGGLWSAQYGMARVAIEKGDFDGALKLLSKGANKKGLADGADQYHFGMAMALLGKGDVDQAEKEALSALNLSPGDSEYGTLVAQIYTKKGALPMAIEAQEKALNQPGARPTASVLHNLGQLYQQQMYQMYKEGNKTEQQRLAPEAMRKYQEAVRLDSTFAPAWKDMGALFALAGKYDEAAGSYLRYAQLAPNDPDGLLGLAQSCMKAKTKRYKQALEAANRAYSLDSTRVANKANSVDSMRVANKAYSVDSMRVAYKAYIVDNMRVDIRLTLARVLFVNRERPRADSLYSTVKDTLALEPEDHIRMGQLKQENGDLAGAETELRYALARDSTSAEGWYSLGLIELKKDNNEGALEDFRKAVRRDPENPTIRLNMGITFLRMRRNHEAVEALREAVRLAPTAVQARVFFAQALMLSDSSSAAIAQYQRGREMDPKNTGVLRGLGLGYLLRKDYTQAISVLTEATEADPNNADGWAWLGQAYANKSEFQKAVDCLEKALKINPNHAKAKELLEALKKGMQSQSPKK